MKVIEVAAAAAAVSMLCACGGGGGGGGVKEVAFTSFPAPNQRVVMTGISQTADGAMTISGSGDITVTGLNPSALDEANSTARLTFSPGNTLSGMSFSTPQSSASFSGNQIDCSQVPACGAQNAAGTSLGVVINPNPALFPLPWNYQTYGVWLNQTGPTTFQVGVMSAGAVTPGGAVPPVGNGFFNGSMTGWYVDFAGTPHSIGATMQANADFAARSISFNTFGTQLGNLNTGVSTTDNNLNLTGTLTYAAGSSQFSGTVTTTSPVLTGTATGRFYGPAAQEMGGVFSLSPAGPGISRMIGAFGGRQ